MRRHHVHPKEKWRRECSKKAFSLRKTQFGREVALRPMDQIQNWVRDRLSNPRLKEKCIVDQYRRCRNDALQGRLGDMVEFQTNTGRIDANIPNRRRGLVASGAQLFYQSFLRIFVTQMPP